MVAIVILVGVLAVCVLLLGAKRKLGTMRAGDLFKIDIPRTLDKPLAMGTRLDIASALKKSGVLGDELRPMLDGNHDQQLLDLYWRHNDLAAAKVV